MLLGASPVTRCCRRRLRADQGRDAAVGARHGAGGHPQGGSGAEHLHLLDRVRPQDDGRHPAVLHRERRAQLLLGLDQRLSHRRGRREPDHAARLHARERLHVRRVLPGARDGHRHVRAEPVVLLQQRPRPRVLGDRPRRPAHLGQGDEEQVRRQRAQPEAQVPHPDVRAFAARAGDRVQRHPHDAAGALRDLRQLQLAAHQRLRRSDHHADRGVGASRDGDPADHQSELGLAKNENPLQGSFIIES
jgi:hypothetical protein